MLFLSDKLYAIQMKSSNNNQRSKIFSIFRVEDSSKLCSFDMTDFEMIYNNSAVRCRNRGAAGILDKKANKVYQVNLESLLHLGATDVRVFQNDF